MKRSNRYAARLLCIACACVLTVSGAWGAAVGVRAAVAQKLYKRAKYGHFLETRLERLPPTDAAAVLRDCERAQRLHPHNYYFPVLASIRALEQALAASEPAVFDRAFRNAEYWNRVALARHPTQIEALQVRCRLLQERGEAKAAAAFWQRHALEREFWNPDRHAFYVELLLKAGEETRAIEAARWLRGGETLRQVRLLEQRRKALRENASRAAPRKAGDGET